jgi:hypothetical protein
MKNNESSKSTLLLLPDDTVILPAWAFRYGPELRLSSFVKNFQGLDEREFLLINSRGG